MKGCYSKSNKLMDFIRQWEIYEIDDEFTSVKRSLSIFLKRELLGENLYSPKKFFNNRFNGIYELIKHIFFYFMFTIKWFLLLLRRDKKEIIIINFLTDKSISEDYIDAIGKSNKYIIINFGIRYELSFLLGFNKFCFPFFFYRYLVYFEDYKDYHDNLLKKLHDTLFSHNIILEKKSDKRIFKNLRHTFYIKIITTYLIEKLLKKRNIKYFIQDLEFISIGYVLTNIFKKKGITTVSIDHALSLYKNEYNSRLSDKYLVWGNHEKLHLINNCHVDDSKINIIGNLKKKNELKRTEANKFKWIYLMQSYNYNIYYLNKRNFIQTKNTIVHLNNFIKKYYPSKELIIKPHPNDKLTISNFNINDITITSNDLDNLMPFAELVIFEDTSSAFDCLSYDSYWVYYSIEDSNAIFENDKAIPKIQCIDKASINNIFAENISWEKRENIFNTYFSSVNKTLFDLNINKILN